MLYLRGTRIIVFQLSGFYNNFGKECSLSDIRVSAFRPKLPAQRRDREGGSLSGEVPVEPNQASLKYGGEHPVHAQLCNPVVPVQSCT